MKIEKNQCRTDTITTTIQKIDLKKPNFIGVGGHKCATTWISECLRYHPQIFVSNPKEIRFFTTYFHKGLAWYLNHFKNIKNQRAVGEFSVSYLTDDDAPKRIKDMLGNVKIIICLRNPVDRFISHYKQYLRSGRLNKKYEHLNEKIIKEIITKYPEMISNGLYCEHLRTYFDLFNNDDIMIVIKDEIDENPQKIIKDLCKFLNVSTDYLPKVLNKQVSPGIIPRIYLIEFLRVRIYIYLHNRIPIIISWIRKFRIAELYRKLNNQKSNNNSINTNIKKELYKYYELDIENLEKLIKIKLDSWKIKRDF
ncbi:sulfotransferase domain-containing protein [Sulfurovum sp.]|uniref:sulfotransferase domain-containing protein n=1 Tax=Sulfurovum sp. TaxID=1969726 RepID=UPI003566D47B